MARAALRRELSHAPRSPEGDEAEHPSPDRPAAAAPGSGRRGRPGAADVAAPHPARGHLAVGYLRRSTDRQEQSIPDQRRAIERYAAEHGIRVLRWYTDDAVSGTSTVGRRAFQALMADAQRTPSDGPGFTMVVVYDVKRFGRIDNDEAGYYRHLLRQAGVEVRYVSEAFTGDGTDDLLRPVKQWQAREESKDLSKVTIRGLLSKIASTSGSAASLTAKGRRAGAQCPAAKNAGWWMGGAPPFGYDLRYESAVGEALFRLRYIADGTKEVLDEAGKRVRTLGRDDTMGVSKMDRCKLVPGDPDRVKVVRSIFRMHVEDRLGYKAIADRLNRTKTPTARGPAWSERYSGQWAMTTIRAILLNPSYCGDLVWNRRTDGRFHKIQGGIAVERKGVVGRRLEPNDEADWLIVRDAHPALVSRRVFEQARQIHREQPASVSQLGINPRTGQRVDARAGGPKFTGWTGPRARFLLSGLCRCGDCNSRYEGYALRNRKTKESQGGEKTYHYACGAYIRRGRSVCEAGLIPHEAFERAIVDAVAAHYEEKGYQGEEGRKRLAVVARRLTGLEHSEVGEALAKARAELDKVETSIGNLLDNITAANRESVDRRLAQLNKERERLVEKTESLQRLTLSQGELKSIVDDVGKLLRTLGPTLREGDLGERQAAMRRCVKEIVVDRTRRKALLSMRLLPTVVGASCEDAVERVEVALPGHAKPAKARRRASDGAGPEQPTTKRVRNVAGKNRRGS